MKVAGDPNFDMARASLANPGGRQGSKERGSKVAGMADMKEMMKKQLEGAKVYEDANRLSPGGVGSGNRQASKNRGTVANAGKLLSSPKATKGKK